MPEIIDCPRCGRRLNLAPELFGRQVQCPACANTFMAQPPPPAAPEAVLYALPAESPPPSMGRPPAPPPYWERPDEPILDEFPDDPIEAAGRWRRVRAGITLMIVGVLVVFFTLGFLLFMIYFAGPRGDEPFFAAALMTIAWVTAIVLEVVGSALCLAAPARRGAHGLATANLVLLILAIVFGVVTTIMRGVRAADGNPFPSSPEIFLSVITLLLTVAEMVVLLCFVRAVALSLNRPGIVRNTEVLMVLGGLFLFLIIFMVLIVFTGGPMRQNNLTENVLPCATGVSGLAFLFWFLFTLSAARNAITRHLGEDQRF